MNKCKTNEHSKLANTQCLIFLTGQIMQKTEWILVKHLTQSVYLNHCSLTKCAPNEHNKLANM